MKRGRPFQSAAIQQKICTAVGMTMMRLAAVKKLRPIWGRPVANMWCTHTLKPTNPVAKSDSTSAT